MDDEVALRLNYHQLISELADLETEVRSAAAADRPPDLELDVAKIEVKLDLLKQQCTVPRKYVTSSVDGSRVSSPTRRRNLIVKITNTVTTIIKVVEDELRRQQLLAEERSVKEASVVADERAVDYETLHRKLSRLHEVATRHSPVATGRHSPRVALEGSPTERINQLIISSTELKSRIEHLTGASQTPAIMEERDSLIRSSEVRRKRALMVS